MTMPPAGPPPGYQGPQGPQRGQNPPHGPLNGPLDVQQNGPRQNGTSGFPESTVQLPRPAGPVGRPQQPAKSTGGTSAAWLLGLAAVLGVVLGLSISEDGHNAWGSVHAWGGLAIAGALATLAPAVGRGLGLGPQRAWQVAVCGAGALILFWVLFTLPAVGSNTSLLVTIGVAAGVLAAWVAPGHDEAGPDRRGEQPPTW
jgi:hypothetical protein